MGHSSLEVGSSGSTALEGEESVGAQIWEEDIGGSTASKDAMWEAQLWEDCGEDCEGKSTQSGG